MKRFLLAALGALELSLGARGQSNQVVFSYSDFAQTPQTLRSLWLYPLWFDPADPGELMAWDRRTYLTDPMSGAAIVTNMLAGLYRGEFVGRWRTTTNWFQIPTNNGVISAYSCLTSNYVVGSGSLFAWSQTQSDARYWQQSVLQAGSNTVFRTNGNQVFIDTEAGVPGAVTNGESGVTLGAPTLTNATAVQGLTLGGVWGATGGTVLARDTNGGVWVIPQFTGDSAGNVTVSGTNYARAVVAGTISTTNSISVGYDLTVGNEIRANLDVQAYGFVAKDGSRFIGDGSGLTNLNGVLIQNSTINSNALDPQTKLKLTLAGTSQFATNAPNGNWIADTNWVAANFQSINNTNGGSATNVMLSSAGSGIGIVTNQLVYTISAAGNLLQWLGLPTNGTVGITVAAAAGGSVTNGLVSFATVQAMTNGFVGPGVTNGLASFATVQGMTNGFVGSGVTNGLVGFGTVQGMTNGFVGSGITNGLVGFGTVQSMTNGFAGTGYVNNATNDLSGVLKTYATTAAQNATNGYPWTNIIPQAAVTAHFATNAPNGNWIADTNWVAANFQNINNTNGGSATNIMVSTSGNGIAIVTNQLVYTISAAGNLLQWLGLPTNGTVGITVADAVGGTVTNGLVGFGTVQGMTNGFVGSGVTNGLVSFATVQGMTNGFLGPNSALDGTKLTVGTVSSNALDAPTKAQLALAGTGGGGGGATNVLYPQSIFVATNGNDTTALPNRMDLPCGTLTNAAAKAQGYDTIWVLGGTYNVGTNVINLPHNVSLRGLGYVAIQYSTDLHTNGCVIVPGNNSLVENLHGFAQTVSNYAAFIGTADFTSTGTYPAHQKAMTNAVVKDCSEVGYTDGYFINTSNLTSITFEHCAASSGWDNWMVSDHSPSMTNVTVHIFDVDIDCEGPAPPPYDGNPSHGIEILGANNTIISGGRIRIGPNVSNLSAAIDMSSAGGTCLVSGTLIDVDTNGFGVAFHKLGGSVINVTQLYGPSTNGFVGPGVTNGLVSFATVQGMTNGFVGSGVTNGLVGSSVTNGLVSFATVQGMTNGFVGPGVTNGLVSFATVQGMTNGFVGSGVTNGLVGFATVQGMTNGFVGSGVTNGLAGSNMVYTASNTLQTAISSISGGSGAPLNGTNTWTGTNKFTAPTTVSALAVTGASVSTNAQLYNPTIFGGTGTSLAAGKLAGYVSIVDLGAVGDGVTDNTLAISNAFALGTNVYVPAGVFLTGSVTSSLPQHISFGDGAILRYNTNATGFMLCLLGPGNTIIGPGYLDGNLTNNYAGNPGNSSFPSPGNRSAVYFNCLANSRMENLSVANFSGFGVLAVSSSPGVDVQPNHYFITGNYFTNVCEAIALGVGSWDSAEYGIISGNKMYQVWCAIDDTGANCDIFGNSCNYASEGYYLRPYDGRGHNNVVGNIFNHCCWPVYITNTISGCIVNDNEMLAGAGVGIQGGANGVIMSGNYIQVTVTGLSDTSTGTNEYLGNIMTTYLGTPMPVTVPSQAIWQWNYDTFFGYIDRGTPIIGNGSGITNLSGAALQSGTVSSNALDAPTAAQLALAGTGGGSGAPLNGTNAWTGTNSYSARVNVNGGIYGNGAGLTNLTSTYLIVGRGIALNKYTNTSSQIQYIVAAQESKTKVLDSYQTFEAGVKPPNWVEFSGSYLPFTWTSVSNILDGTNSICFEDSAVRSPGAFYNLPTSYQEISVSFLFMATHWPVSRSLLEICDLYDVTGNDEVCDVYLAQNGSITLNAQNSAPQMTVPMPTNQVVRFWIHWERRTPNTGFASVAWSTNINYWNEPVGGGSLVNKTLNYIDTGDGLFADDIGKVLLGPVSEPNLQFIYDDLRISYGGEALEPGNGIVFSPHTNSFGNSTLVGVSSALSNNISIYSTNQEGLATIGNTNGFYQLRVKNTNSGTNASSDFVAEADNGNDGQYYLDMGINSSGYTNFLGATNDAYLYVQGGTNAAAGANLYIASITTNAAYSGSIKFVVGTNNNVVATISSNGVTAVGITNTGLTASRLVFGDANKKEVSAAASGAVPVNADGSTSTAAQVVTLLSTTAVGRATGDASGNTITTTYAPLASPSLTTPTLGAASASSITVSGIAQVQTFDNPTNTFTADTPIGLGTNLVYVNSGTKTLGITGVLGQPTSTERYGQLTIINSGLLTFTNWTSVHVSDHLTTRTIPATTNLVISVDVIPGQSTNIAIGQF